MALKLGEEQVLDGLEVFSILVVITLLYLLILFLSICRTGVLTLLIRSVPTEEHVEARTADSRSETSHHRHFECLHVKSFRHISIYF